MTATIAELELLDALEALAAEWLTADDGQCDEDAALAEFGF